MPAILMLAAVLGAPPVVSPAGASGQGQKAWEYFQEGLEAYRKERFTSALPSFEMAVRLARFAFGAEQLVGEGLHMAAASALRAGLARPALRNARDYLAWAEGGRKPGERLQALLDVAEAYLLLGTPDEARDTLAEARAALARAADAEAAERLARAERRLAEMAPRRPGAGEASRRLAGQGLDAIAKELGQGLGLARAGAPEPPPGMLLVEGGKVAVEGQGGEAWVDAFWIDDHEVSNQEYRAFVRTSGHVCEGDWEAGAGGGDQVPVRGVSLADALAYARHHGKRLATDAEWARARERLRGSLPRPGARGFDPREGFRCVKDLPRDPGTVER